MKSDSTKSVQHQQQRRHPRGQATVEYSMVSHALLFFGGVGILPMAMNIMSAITSFYDSVYQVIQSAAF
jgi:hypothetical protein